MSKKEKKYILVGQTGYCGGKKVFIGFAPANVLHSVSFADVLNEDNGKGYQRRFNNKHSLDFRKYIQQPGSTTIPLTFNLRPDKAKKWELVVKKNGQAKIIISSLNCKVLSQVDCQHRLGYLSDLEIPMVFMTFIGLSPQEEMKTFNVINGRARGLSTSLLDFHDSQLIEDLGRIKPELLVATRLTDDSASPWFRGLDLGGNSTSGMTRRASLRTMQKAVKRFLKETNILNRNTIDEAYVVVRNFWCAITTVLDDEWKNPRKHFVTKGIGVYSLMSLLGDLYTEAIQQKKECSKSYFSGVLSDFIDQFDWSNSGPLKGLGGEAGVSVTIGLLRELREKSRLKVV